MTTTFAPSDLDAPIDGYPPPLPLIERQQRTEANANKRGVARYRREIAEADLGDTPPGLRAAREMMEGLVPAVEAAQAEAVAGITETKGPGRRPQWWWMIQFLPADRLAYIAIRTLLSTPRRHVAADAFGSSVTTVILAIGRRVREEMELEAWRKAEADQKKADPEHVNLANRLMQKAGFPDAQTFRRWKKKLHSIERLEWTPEMRAHIGGKLLDLAVRHGGGWFEVQSVWTNGRTELHVGLTEAATTAINDINSTLEVQRPFLLPMVAPPKQWTREES